MRGAATSTMVMRFLTAMALKKFGFGCDDNCSLQSGFAVQNANWNVFFTAGTLGYGLWLKKPVPGSSKLITNQAPRDLARVVITYVHSVRSYARPCRR
jgi:hypothetical protein